MVDPIAGDPADVPEGARAGAVGIKEKQRPGLAGGDFEIESGDMVAIDRLETDRQRDVAEPVIGDFGDERRRDLRRFPEIEQRTIALLDQPVEAGGRGRCRRPA